MPLFRIRHGRSPKWAHEWVGLRTRDAAQVRLNTRLPIRPSCRRERGRFPSSTMPDHPSYTLAFAAFETINREVHPVPTRDCHGSFFIAPAESRLLISTNMLCSAMDRSYGDSNRGDGDGGNVPSPYRTSKSQGHS